MTGRPNLPVFGKIFGAVVLGGALAMNFACSSLETKPSTIDQREQLKEKVDQLIANGELDPVQAKTTRFTEAELNSALNGQIAEWIPNGISEPQVQLLATTDFLCG